MKTQVRNNKSHRHTEANAVKTKQRVESYLLLIALLQTWEEQPDEIQCDNHDYIIQLRAKVRTAKNYLINRSDPDADVV